MILDLVGGHNDKLRVRCEAFLTTSLALTSANRDWLYYHTADFPFQP